MRDEEKLFAFIHPSSLPPSSLLWRGARVVELAALEMLCTGNRTVGSNPTLSARNHEKYGSDIQNGKGGKLPLFYSDFWLLNSVFCFWSRH